MEELDFTGRPYFLYQTEYNWEGIYGFVAKFSEIKQYWDKLTSFYSKIKISNMHIKFRGKKYEFYIHLN